MAPVAASFSRSATASPASPVTDWLVLQMVAEGYNVGGMAMLRPEGTVGITGNHPDGVAVLGSLSVSLRTASPSSEQLTVELGLFADDDPNPFASDTIVHTTGTTPGRYSFSGVGRFDSGAVISARMRLAVAPSSAVLECTFAELALARTGGAPGVQGPQGPPGLKGDPGPQGIPGNAGTGYGTFAGINAAADTYPGTISDNAQGLPLPSGTDVPAIPAIFKTMSTRLAKLVVRRHADRNSMMNAPDSEAGQINYLDSNSAFMVENMLAGVRTYAPLAQVLYGTGDPPLGSWPAGSVYFKVTSA
jgi:hypothetical protein